MKSLLILAIGVAGAALAQSSLTVGRISSGKNLQVPGFDDRPTNIYVSEVCISGYKYLLTDRGGISPKIGPASGSFGHTGTYIQCSG